MVDRQDNSSTSFRASANWRTLTDSPQRYCADFQVATPEPISDSAWYSVDLTATGTTWRCGIRRTPITTTARRTSIRTSSGKQQVYVNVVGVSRWSSGTGYVIADAVRISRIA